MKPDLFKIKINRLIFLTFVYFWLILLIVSLVEISYELQELQLKYFVHENDEIKRTKHNF